MTIYSKTVKYITYPIWTIREKKTMLFRYLLRYRKYHKCSFHKLAKLQAISLTKILSHAYNQTVYYKNVFDNYDVRLSSPYEVSNVIKNIPILTKEIIWENQSELIANNVREKDLFQSSTGGSTGTPLVFYRDKLCILKRKAQEVFFDKWMGCEIGDKIALFVAARHSPKGLRGFKSKFRNATCDRILSFDPSRTDKPYMESFLEKLRDFKPKIIKCFPNSLYIFANFLREKGVDDIRVTAVSCTGETLHDYQRRLFENVFQCPVYEKYGTFESGVIACECSEHDGMHIFMDGVFVEFLNDKNELAKPGELANIVITDLFNYGMPFVRYKIGDVGLFSDEKCTCGSNLPMIKKLCGRDRDILVDNDGNPKPGYLFVEIFNKNKIPGKFQVMQNGFNEITIKIVKMPGFDESGHEEVIKNNFYKLLGNDLSVNFSYVDQIQREASGKYRYVHSQISPF